MSTSTYGYTTAQRDQRSQEILQALRDLGSESVDRSRHEELWREFKDLHREQTAADKLEFETLAKQTRENYAAAWRSVRTAFCVAGAGLVMAAGLVGYIVVKNA